MHIEMHAISLAMIFSETTPSWCAGIGGAKRNWKLKGVKERESCEMSGFKQGGSTH